MRASKILITGANGFVGKAICEYLINLDIDVKGTVRYNPTELYQLEGPSLSEDGYWMDCLHDVDVVIHCAARVHVLPDREADSLAIFRSVNRDGTLSLARQAESVGVRRFIFISSIKVNGEVTELGHPFVEEIDKVPEDPYALSKYEAELGLMSLAADSNMEITIIRTPIIYGPRVKANFASMIKWVSIGIPLPFARIKNSRSLLGIPNLCDFIFCVLTHPAAANQIFLVADQKPYSTSILLSEIARAQGRKVRLFYLPPAFIMLLGKLFGLEVKLQRLLGSLEIDTGKAQELLQWKAPFGLADILPSTVSFPSEKC